MLLAHGMLQTHFQNGADMVIRQRIPDIFALPAEADQVHLLQDPQLVGYAAENGIPGVTMSMLKADMIAAIRAAEEA